MNRATIIGMILVTVLMVPGMASCSGVATPADSGASYTTSAQPTTVVTKIVPVVVSRPTAPVIINPYPAPPSWWQNWRWPWQPRP
jgi:Ca2+/H+ antiporter